MRQDFRYALRLLRRSPAFTIVATLTIAIGVGANTAMFSVVRAALLAPPPFADPDRLAVVWEGYPPQMPRAAVSAPGFLDIRDSREIFADAAAFSLTSLNLTGGGEPERVVVARVTHSFQPVLGLRLALGRWFDAAEDAPNQNDAVVLSDGLWRRRFGADASVVGRSISLNDRSYRIVGVMAVDGYPKHAEAWVPIAFTPAQRAADSRGSQYLDVIARLRPELTREQAAAALQARARIVRAAYYADTPAWTLGMRPLRDEITGAARPVLLASFGAVGLVLLIACANVANLLLARAADRRRELAVRSALGAAPSHLRRQLLAEAAWLGLAGAAGGILIAWLARPALAMAVGRAFPTLAAPTLDLRVFAFGMLAAIGSTAAFGVAPAWQVSRTDLRASLVDGDRGTPGRRARRAFVGAELAMAFALLVGAGLLVRSFARIVAIDPGFRVDRQLTLRVSLPAVRYPAAADRAAFWSRVLDRLASLPGVRAAGGVSELPLSDMRNMGTFEIEGRPSAPADLPHANLRSASPGYFAAMGIRLVDGRWFDDRDGAGTPRVALVDELARARYWPGGTAIGHRVTFSDDADGRPIWNEIVGVVQTVHHDSLEETVRPTLYLALAQRPTSSAFAVVRAGGDPSRLAAEARAAVRAIDPLLPIYDTRTLEARLAESVGARRIATSLIAMFGIVAVALALIGVYGVVSYDVGRRSKEIAVRMALGASRPVVLALVIGGGVRLAAMGIACGFVLALATARMASTLLFGISPYDPSTYVTLAAALLVVTTAATFVPARRAATVEPSETLRQG
jgi:putative ABC transport system permease protein